MSINILVVDDDKQNRELISNVLEKFGFDTELASDAQSAIDKMEENVFHIVITDKNMPGIESKDEGGMDVLKYIRQHYPSVQVIIITGYATVETATEAMKLGAFDYLTKPFSVEELVGKIERLVEYRQFIEPDVIIENYKAIQNEALSLIVNRDPLLDTDQQQGLDTSADADQQHELITCFNQKLDRLFSQVKKQEYLITEHRENMTEILELAEQALEMLEPGTEPHVLIENVCKTARRKI